MFLMGLPSCTASRSGIVLAVAVAVPAALTLLPALLGFVGLNIDRLHLGRRTPRERDFWQRWARTCSADPLHCGGRPPRLVVMAVPALQMRIGSADASNDPTRSTTHRAYELVARGSRPGQNGPILVTPRAPPLRGASPRLDSSVRATPGVATVTNPAAEPTGTPPWRRDPKTVRREATPHLVHDLRAMSSPPPPRAPSPRLPRRSDRERLDFADIIGARLPLFIGAVLAVSFLLLLLVFRSLLVPLKAVLMNLLSIGAAYGVIVAVFQWGWGSTSSVSARRRSSRGCR